MSSYIKDFILTASELQQIVGNTSEEWITCLFETTFNNSLLENYFGIVIMLLIVILHSPVMNLQKVLFEKSWK